MCGGTQSSQPMFAELKRHGQSMTEPRLDDHGLVTGYVTDVLHWSTAEASMSGSAKVVMMRAARPFASRQAWLNRWREERRKL